MALITKPVNAASAVVHVALPSSRQLLNSAAITDDGAGTRYGYTQWARTAISAATPATSTGRIGGRTFSTIARVFMPVLQYPCSSASNRIRIWVENCVSV